MALDPTNVTLTVINTVITSGTLAYLLITDWPALNFWNWIYIIPLDVIFSILWPLYWFAIHGLL